MCYKIIPPCTICHKKVTLADAALYRHFRKSDNRMHDSEFHIDVGYISICDDCIEKVNKFHYDNHVFQV